MQPALKAPFVSDHSQQETNKKRSSPKAWGEVASSLLSGPHHGSTTLKSWAADPPLPLSFQRAVGSLIGPLHGQPTSFLRAFQVLGTDKSKTGPGLIPQRSLVPEWRRENEREPEVYTEQSSQNVPLIPKTPLLWQFQ